MPIRDSPHWPSFLLLPLSSSSCHCNCIRCCQVLILSLLAVLLSYQPQTPTAFNECAQRSTDLPLRKSQVHLSSLLRLQSWLFFKGASDNPSCDCQIPVVAGDVSLSNQHETIDLRQACGFPCECHSTNWSAEALVKCFALGFLELERELARRAKTGAKTEICAGVNPDRVSV